MSVNDRLMKAFEEYGGLTLNERIYHFLGSLGFTNSLSDRLAKYTSGRYRGYRALIEDFGRSSQPWEDLFAEGQTLHFDFIKQRYGVRVPEALTLVAGDSIYGVGYLSEELAAAAGDPELATGSISDQPVSGFNLLGLEFTDTGIMTQLDVYFQGDVEESLASIRVWVGGVEVEGPPSALLYDVNLDVTVVAYANPNTEPWVVGGQYNIGITLDGNEPSAIIDYTSNVNDLGILTRASAATYWGPSGTLLESAVDEARIQHDPVTGEALGLLIEPSRTNAAYLNNDLASFLGSYINTPYRDNTVYQNIEETELGIGGVTLSAVEDGSVGGSQIEPLVSITSPYALSAFIKAGSASSVSLTTARSSGSQQAAVALDTLTGEVFIYGVAVSGGAVPLKGGWWRLWVIRPVVDSNSGSVYASVRATGLSAGESITVAGINAEVGSYPTSYIPTSGSPVTRAEDYFGLNMGDKASSTGGTFRVTAQVPKGEVVMLISSQASGFLTLYSDSDEMKTYTLSHPEDVVTFALGYGIHQSLEYFPEAQS